MSETRSVSRIEVRAETRGIKEVGKELDKAFDPARLDQFDATVQRFSEDVGGLTKELSDLAKELAKVAQAMNGGGGAGARGGAGGSRGGGTAAGAVVGGAIGGAIGAAAGQSRRSNGRFGEDAPPPTWRDRMRARAARVGAYGQGVATSAAGGQFAEQALGGIPIVGGVLAGAMGSARRYTHMSDALSGAQAGAYGRTGRGVGSLTGFGASYGLDANAMVGELSGIGQSTGLRGDALSDELVQGVMRYSRQMGVDGGGIVGANVMGGGSPGRDPVGMISDAVGTAIQSGFREGNVNKYLQEIAAFTESARRDGINLTTESANQMTRGMTGLGLSAEAASSAGLGAAGALRSAGDSNNYLSRVAMGIGMGSMGMTYMQSRSAMEERTPEMMERVQRQMWADSGGNVEVMARLLQESGLAPSYTAALTMADSFASVGGEAALGFGASSGESFAGDEGREALEARRGGYNALSGGARFRAGITNREIRTGGQVAGTVHGIENLEVGLTTSLVGGLNTALVALKGLAEEVGGFIRNGDWAGLFQHFMTMAQSGATAAVRNLVPQTARTHGSAAGNNMTSQAQNVANANQGNVVGAAATGVANVGRAITTISGGTPVPPPPAPAPAAPAPGPQSSAALGLQSSLLQAAEHAGQLGNVQNANVGVGHA